MRYIVSGSCGLDDIVISDCMFRCDADDVAARTTPDDIIRIAREVYGRDVSIVFGVDIVTLDYGPQWQARPVKFERVKDFDESAE